MSKPPPGPVPHDGSSLYPDEYRVLVVSSPDDSDGVVDAFACEGFTVLTADSERAARDRIDDERVGGVVVSDSLPGIDLLEFLQAVRETHPQLPVVAFPEAGDETVARAVLSQPYTGYVKNDGSPEQTVALCYHVRALLLRLQAESTAQTRERLLSVAREVNQELIRAENRDELERRVCEALTGTEPYLLAWIGQEDPDTHEVRVRAAAGHDSGYLNDVDIVVGDPTLGAGPTGRAIQTSEIQVVQNITDSASFRAWRDEAVERGYLSSAAIPLVYADTTFGVLNVYAGRRFAFDADECALLEELAGDVAFAMHAFETRTELERTRHILDEVADGAAILRDEVFVYVNEPLATMTGYAREEMDGMALADFVAPEYLDVVRERYHARSGGADPPSIYEIEIVTATGEHLPVELSASRFEHGGEQAVVKIVRDISERKAREAALRESEKRFRAVFEEAFDAMLLADDEGRYVAVNSAACDLFGYSEPELLGRSIREFAPPEYDFEAAWTAFQASDRDRGTFPLVRSDGTRRTVEYAASTNVVPGRHLSVLRDVTGRERSEHELRRTKERLSVALEGADMGVWEWDVRTDDIVWDESCERLFGLEPGTFDGNYEGFIRRVHPDDRADVEHALERAASQHDDLDTEFRIVRDDGLERWVVARGRLVTDDDGTPVRMVGVDVDATERKEREQHLEVLDRVLRHNMRNDLNVVLGLADMIENGTSDDPADDAARIIRQVTDLLNMADKERAIVDVLLRFDGLEVVDVARVAEHVVADARSKYPNADVRFASPGTATVAALSKLDLALAELVENAIVYSEADTPVVEVTVTDREDAVTVSIADNGPGISDMEVDVLIGDHPIEPLFHGSGLGLWLVNWTVTRSNGTLDIEPNTPHGTVVTVTLQPPSWHTAT